MSGLFCFCIIFFFVSLYIKAGVIIVVVVLLLPRAAPIADVYACERAQVLVISICVRVFSNRELLWSRIVLAPILTLIFSERMIRALVTDDIQMQPRVQTSIINASESRDLLIALRSQFHNIACISLHSFACNDCDTECDFQSIPCSLASLFVCIILVPWHLLSCLKPTSFNALFWLTVRLCHLISRYSDQKTAEFCTKVKVQTDGCAASKRSVSIAKTFHLIFEQLSLSHY